MRGEERNKIMRKSIKLLSLLLAVALLCVFMASCKGETEHTETEHTEHVGAGKCEVCGLDYFDTLVQYIYENGTTGTPPMVLDDKYKTTYISQSINDTKAYYICVDDNTVKIVYQYTGNTSSYKLVMSFTKSTMKYNEWAWESHSSNLILNGGISFSGSDYEGEMCPEKISPASPIRLDVHNDPTQTSIEPEPAPGLINDFFIPLIAEVGHNLTPSDFGFVRFED